MIKKTMLYLVAIAVVAFAVLLVLSANVPFMSPEVAENATSDGAEAFDVQNASPTVEVTSAPDTEENELIFLSKRGYINESGCPTVIGEVKNGGDFSMKDIMITASFYCSGGKLIGEKEGLAAVTSSYSEVGILAPGETSPFKIAISVEELSQLENFELNKLEKYKIEGEYNITDAGIYKRFEISQSPGELNTATGHYRVAGNVKNIGNEAAEQIKVVVTFYDDQTRITDVMHTYLENSLLPGEEAQFEIIVRDQSIVQRIETYHILAVGS